MQLFADRGWDAVITDDLVGNAIFLTSVVIGIIIGAVGAGSTAFVGYAYRVEIGEKKDHIQKIIQESLSSTGGTGEDGRSSLLQI